LIFWVTICLYVHLLVGSWCLTIVWMAAFLLLVAGLILAIVPAHATEVLKQPH
jgi:hypothetical protein